MGFKGHKIIVHQNHIEKAIEWNDGIWYEDLEYLNMDWTPNGIKGYDVK